MVCLTHKVGNDEATISSILRIYFLLHKLSTKVRWNNSRREGDMHDGTASYCTLVSDKQAGQGNRHKYTSAATQIRDSEKATTTVQSQ
jgi:hypothetical protein